MALEARLPIFFETQVRSDVKEGILTGVSCDPLEEILCTVGNMTIRAECIEPDDVDVNIDPLTRHVRVDIVRFY